MSGSCELPDVLGWRSDVRTWLLRHGWKPCGHFAMERGSVVWAPANKGGDSFLSRYNAQRSPEYTIEFTSEVPTHVIAAACEAAAKGARRG